MIHPTIRAVLLRGVMIRVRDPSARTGGERRHAPIAGRRPKVKKDALHRRRS
jgi:hypothetical protein